MIPLVQSVPRAGVLKITGIECGEIVIMQLPDDGLDGAQFVLIPDPFAIFVSVAVAGAVVIWVFAEGDGLGDVSAIDENPEVEIVGIVALAFWIGPADFDDESRCVVGQNNVIWDDAEGDSEIF